VIPEAICYPETPEITVSVGVPGCKRDAVSVGPMRLELVTVGTTVEPGLNVIEALELLPAARELETEDRRLGPLGYQNA
jgi:hypothetical protein